MHKVKINILLTSNGQCENSEICNFISKMKKFSGSCEIFNTKDDFSEKQILENFDVILLNLSLSPNYNTEILSKFLNEFPKIPIIVITENEDDALGHKVIEMGAQDYLVKNRLDINSFERSIRYSIERNKYRYEIFKNKERLKLVLEAACGGYWDLFIYEHDKRELFCSPACYTMLGYEPFEFPSTMEGWIKNVSSEHRELVIQAIENNITGKNLSNEIQFKIQTKQGNIKWILQKSKLVVDNQYSNFKRISGINLDITKIKKGEHQLENQKKLAQMYLNVVGVMVIIINFTGKIELINRKGCEILEANEDEILGLNWFDNFLPDKYKIKVNNYFNKLKNLEESVDYNFENPIKTKKNNIKLISWYNTYLEDSEGNFIGILASGLDITEKRKAEDELTTYKYHLESLIEERTQKLLQANEKLKKEIKERQLAEKIILDSKRQFKDMFYKHGAVMLLIEPINAKIIDANTAAVNYYGYSFSELKAMKIGDINTLSGKEIIKEMEKALCEKRNYFEFKHKLKNGEIRDVEVLSSPIWTGERKILFSIINDITSKKRAEQQVYKEKLKAETINRFKDEFLAYISHEIRTPLSLITLNASYLIREKTLNGENLQRLKQMQKSVQSALQIITEVLDISKIEAGLIETKTETFDINELVNEILNENFIQIDTEELKVIKNVEINTITSDRKRIKQVITNLFTNAIKYTPKGSITIKINEKNGNYNFSVIDTGRGIPKEYQDKIFEPFFRIDKQRYKKKGMGLGLNICKKITTALGGNITVESEPEKGSIFSFYIPKD